AKGHIVAPGGRAHAHPLTRQLQFAAQVREAPRKLTCDVLATALKHSDAFARACEPGCRYPTAVARAHDDDVVARLQPVERASEASHGVSNRAPHPRPVRRAPPAAEKVSRDRLVV